MHKVPRGTHPYSLARSSILQREVVGQRQSKTGSSRQLVVPFFLVDLVEAIVEILYGGSISNRQPGWHDVLVVNTLGRVTLGTITVFRALGASRTAWVLSPCGWY